MAGNTTPKCEKAALFYRRLGWSVIPLQAGGKTPLVPWRAYQERRADEAEIRAWFASWPEANVGLVTGQVSGLLVLDLDPRHGAEESLAAWVSKHGELPPTPQVLTGGGGRHFYFASTDGSLRNRVALRPGIDVRGRGGMVVAPPSLHPSGKRYRWAAERAPNEVALAPLPVWLSHLLKAADSGRGHPLAHWRALVRRGVEQGERNNTLASFAGHLLWHGVDPEVVLELLMSWNRDRCRPPLDDGEVARVVSSITRLHAREEEGNAP